jgi:hypothetical protein
MVTGGVTMLALPWEVAVTVTFPLPVVVTTPRVLMVACAAVVGCTIAQFTAASNPAVSVVIARAGLKAS